MSRNNATIDYTRKRNLEGYGLKIKNFRKKKKMSADDLAQALQVSVSSVRNWECGLSRPDPEYLFRMFTILEVDPNTFFDIHRPGESLTDPEKQIIDCYRTMDDRGQKEYAAIGKILADQCHLLRLKAIRERIVAVPDYGRFAAAGAGDYWSDNVEETILLYDSEITEQADEIITVSGHSMEPNYHDHDRVLVQYCRDIRVGEVYVFSLRGQGCVIKEAARDRLHSQNEAYMDIIPDQDDGAELIGRVLGVISDDMVPTFEELALYNEAEKTL